jgi:hypothetical protein
LELREVLADSKLALEELIVAKNRIVGELEGKCMEYDEADAQLDVVKKRLSQAQ